MLEADKQRYDELVAELKAIHTELNEILSKTLVQVHFFYDDFGKHGTARGFTYINPGLDLKVGDKVLVPPYGSTDNVTATICNLRLDCQPLYTKGHRPDTILQKVKGD